MYPNGPIPLLTTTRRVGVNPGDTLIGIGLQYLFERALGPLCWLPIDRFGPSGFREYEDLIRSASFLVYGGMPQYNNFDRWRHWYDGPLWTRYIRRWGLRIFTMAGGAGSREWVPIDQWVADCLSSRRTRRWIQLREEPSLCITVRDPYADRLLDALGIPHHYLPCSATWAARRWNLPPAPDRTAVALVPSTPSTEPRHQDGRRLSRSERRERYRRRWQRLYQALREEVGPVRVICHGVDEYRALGGAIPAEALTLPGEPFELLREYSTVGRVVSARLHGSLPAYGIPGTRVVHLSVDVRGSAVEPFPKIQHLQLEAATPERLLEALAKASPSAGEDLTPYEEQYIAAIHAGLERLQAEQTD